MKRNFLMIATILLVLAVIIFVGQHLMNERFVPTQYAINNNIRDCGSENNTSKSSIRTCILEAFNTCEPAYAETHINKRHESSWEVVIAKLDASVEVKKNSTGECGIQYVDTRPLSLSCEQASISDVYPNGGRLRLSACTAIEGKEVSSITF